MILYSLFHAVPSQFVTLSWTVVALLFFLLSLLIHNIKYRWLAITAMVVATFHLFIFDLSSMSIGYRIIALLFIAIIALGISLFYTRRQKQKKENP
jgi:membrane protein implicated in regulation of membrane protease activity